MKRYLLDTHVWIWSVSGPETLSHASREVLEDGDQVLSLSAASIWEIALLNRRIPDLFDRDVAAWLDYARHEYPITELPITSDIALDSQLVELPHRDPADRFIAATARAHDLVLITRDEALLAAPTVETFAA